VRVSSSINPDPNSPSLSNLNSQFSEISNKKNNGKLWDSPSASPLHPPVRPHSLQPNQLHQVLLQRHPVPRPLRGVALRLRRRHPAGPPPAGPDRPLPRPQQNRVHQNLRGQVQQVQGPEAARIRRPKRLRGGDQRRRGPPLALPEGAQALQAEGPGLRLAHEQRGDVGQLCAHRREHVRRRVRRKGAEREDQGRHQGQNGECGSGHQQCPLSHQPVCCQTLVQVFALFFCF